MSRKLAIRLVGAPLLLAALGAILVWGGRSGLTLLLVAVSAVCSLELHAMFALKGIPTARVVGTVVAAALPLSIVYLPAGDGRHALAAWPAAALSLFVVIYALVKLVARPARFTPEAAGATVLTTLYVGLISLVLVPPAPSVVPLWYLVFLVATGKGSDMAAFAAGKAFGRHKMAPLVSPNKTWEGGIAGAVAGTLAGVAVLRLTSLNGAYCRVPIAALLAFSLLVTIAGQVGDLVKSAIKRWAGVKDSGRLLPEFGGMLDMADSFLLGVPVAYAGSRLLFAVFG
ncbi:MAG TPA: CDP-archaeol synthase [Planctomycetota bacterium]|nr:CDP-archaeol synthase [Planctomycetota bacterium]